MVEKMLCRALTRIELSLSNTDLRAEIISRVTRLPVLDQPFCEPRPRAIALCSFHSLIIRSYQPQIAVTPYLRGLATPAGPGTRQIDPCAQISEFSIYTQGTEATTARTSTAEPSTVGGRARNAGKGKREGKGKHKIRAGSEVRRPPCQKCSCQCT